MKSRVNRILSVGIVLAAAMAAHAQTPRLTADVPFPFYVGTHLMPQGSYKVDETADGHVAWIRSMGQRDALQAITTFNVEGKKLTEPARLVFHRYGDEYFLAQIWTGMSSTGLALRTTTKEKELAQAGVPGAVAIIRVALYR